MDAPVSNYVASRGDAIALLQARGAPMTPYNLQAAVQLLNTNPQLRPNPAVMDGNRPGDVQGSQLPGLNRAFPPTAADENAVSAQMNGGQSLLNTSTDPAGMLSRAMTPKPVAPTADVTDPAAQEGGDYGQDAFSAGSAIPAGVAAGGAALLSALARRRGVSAPASAGPRNSGVVVDRTSPAGGAARAAPSGETAASPTAAATDIKGAAQMQANSVGDAVDQSVGMPRTTGETIPLKDDAASGKGSSGVNLGVNEPNADAIQTAKRNLREAKAAKDYAKIRRWKGTLSKLEGGGAE